MRGHFCLQKQNIWRRGRGTRQFCRRFCTLISLKRLFYFGEQEGPGIPSAVLHRWPHAEDMWLSIVEGWGSFLVSLSQLCLGTLFPSLTQYTTTITTSTSTSTTSTSTSTTRALLFPSLLLLSSLAFCISEFLYYHCFCFCLPSFFSVSLSFWFAKYLSPNFFSPANAREPSSLGSSLCFRIPLPVSDILLKLPLVSLEKQAYSAWLSFCFINTVTPCKGEKKFGKHSSFHLPCPPATSRPGRAQSTASFKNSLDLQFQEVCLMPQAAESISQNLSLSLSFHLFFSHGRHGGLHPEILVQAVCSS